MNKKIFHVSVDNELMKAVDEYILKRQYDGTLKYNRVIFFQECAEYFLKIKLGIPFILRKK